MIFVTGGAGFIGSNFLIDWIASSDRPEAVLNIDALTYAGNLENLVAIERDPAYRFCKLDICARDQVLALMREHRPRAIVHFAAESHVDRLNQRLVFYNLPLKYIWYSYVCRYEKSLILENDVFYALYQYRSQFYVSLSSDEIVR